MIYIETTRGPKMFTKAVFVWSGHVISGWPTSFHEYIYNDEINGLLCFGNDDEVVEELSWFTPNGVVPRDRATCATPSHGLEAFKQLYGDRLIVWINPKENLPMISAWAMSDYVVTPADLKMEPFTGQSRSEFKEWAQVHLDKVSRTDTSISVLKRV